MGAAKRKAAASPRATADATLTDYKRKFSLSQDLCMRARTKAETDQDYYDGKQWTDDEKRILKDRRQPATVFNEVKPGVNGIIGIVERGKTDPRAYGRGKNDSDGAEVATDCLRYVADKNRFQNLRSQGMKDFFIPGIVSCVVEVDEDREVIYRKGRYEAYFYDPYSREPDFSDARWQGLANWTDEDDALTLPWVDSDEKRKFIKQSVDLAEPGMGSPNETTQDRPKNGAWSWGDNKKRRLMVVQMWYKKGPIWYMCVFVSAGVLHDGPSEYKDDRGRPTCNLIAQSCYVDRDNERYGVVRDMIGPQDAMNKGWSKAIHILNVAQLRVDPGVGDVDEIRRQKARPDGIIELRKEQMDEIGDRELLPAHMQMLNLAEQKMRRQTPTPGIVGRNAQSQSGKAILAEQQAGMTEQAPTLGSFDDWTLRIYRMTWACIKQYWDAPKYIRVTDDENAPKYVLLNQPEPVTDKNGKPVFVMSPNGQPVVDPKTGQPVPQMRMIKPAELDVDIIIDSTPDTATLQEDQYQKLIELETVLAQTGSPDRIPTKAIIAASALPKKREILDAMDQAAEERKSQPQPQSPAEQEQAKQQVALQGKQQMNEMDAQAHMATLARQDQADAAKTNRAMTLETHKFNLQQQAANSQAMRDERRSRQDAKLKRQQAAAAAQGGGEGGEAGRQAQGELPFDNGEEDDMNFNINLSPEVQQALLESVVQTKQAVAQRQVQAADQAAQAQAALPQALMALAQSMREAAQAQVQAAQATMQAAAVQAAPKVLKVVNGEKMAVPLLNGTMQ